MYLKIVRIMVVCFFMSFAFAAIGMGWDSLSHKTFSVLLKIILTMSFWVVGISFLYFAMVMVNVIREKTG